MSDPPDRIRDAATVILWRGGAAGPEVLMGMRGAKAAFMPSKFVFPGGALDPADRDVALATPPGPETAARLEIGAPGLGPALCAAAIRELWEETGLILGVPGDWPLLPPAGDWPTPPPAGDWSLPPPAGWEGFAATGHRPAAGDLAFIFRAITPAGRPRRFDARFFLAPATAIAGDPEDFARASDELSALQWIPLGAARGFDLPFITEVVLAEAAALIATGAGPESVPFFDNGGPRAVFRRLV